MYRIKVPATSANLGPGFDSLGLAIKLYNTFTFKEYNGDLRVSLFDYYTKREFKIAPENNLVCKAMEVVYKLNKNSLRNIELWEGVAIPLARGLGSSASAVVAGLVGANLMLGNPLSDDELIKLAIEIEGHPDNVLPAFKGGFIINVSTDHDLVYKKIRVKEGIKLLIVIPDFELKTAELRNVLPQKVSYGDAVFNHSRTALLTASLADGDWEKLAIAMEDRLHQDYRSSLIPGFKEVVKAGYQAGAIGVALSGAGPSILAITQGKEESIGSIMQETFASYGVNANYLITEIDNQGLKIEQK